MDFKAKRREQEEVARRKKSSSGSGLLGGAPRSGRAGRVGAEYDSGRQAADVLGGDDGPAHEVLASGGRRSSTSSQANQELQLQASQLSPELGRAHLGRATPGLEEQADLEMANLQRPHEAGFGAHGQKAGEDDHHNSIEDMMEPAPGTALDLGQGYPAQPEYDNGFQSQPRSSLLDVPDQREGLAEPPDFNDQLPDGYALQNAANTGNLATHQPVLLQADGATPQANDRRIQMAGTNQQLLFSDEDGPKYDEGKDQ